MPNIRDVDVLEAEERAGVVMTCNRQGWSRARGPKVGAPELDESHRFRRSVCRSIATAPQSYGGSIVSSGRVSLGRMKMPAYLAPGDASLAVCGMPTETIRPAARCARRALSHVHESRRAFRGMDLTDGLLPSSSSVSRSSPILRLVLALVVVGAMDRRPDLSLSGIHWSIPEPHRRSWRARRPLPCLTTDAGIRRRLPRTRAPLR